MLWLTTPVRDRKVYLWILGSLIVGYIKVSVVFAIFDLLGLTLHPQASEAKINITSSGLPFFLIFMALIEEVIFRLPLAVAVEAEAEKSAILLFALLLSLAFGLAHGSILNIFIQGFGGFIYCILFLKCGGYQKKYSQALAVTTTAHFLWNLSVSFIALYHGYTSI